MRRDIQTVLLAAALALPLAATVVPTSAEAGIVTDGKTAGKAADFTLAYLSRAGIVTDGKSATTASTAPAGWKPADDGTGDGSGGPNDPNGPHLLGAYELMQLEQGLITEEEAMSGCGASAAGGQAGLGALIAVGLALALRRRR